MFREWLGDAQTIRLDRWAVAVGMRRSYLDSLSMPRRAMCLAVYDRDRMVHEVLYVILNRWQLDLHVLAADDGELPAADLDALAARCPGGGPLLGAVLMSRRAAGEFLTSLVTDGELGDLFRARLAADYGLGWSVAAGNPLVVDFFRKLLTGGVRSRLQAAMRYLDRRVVVLNNDGAPATWGGGWFADGRFHALPPGELIGAADAVWVDERLIGEGLRVVSESLDRPARDARPLFLALFALLKRGYLRLPGIPLGTLRLMPSVVGGRWLGRLLFSPLPPVPPLPPCAGHRFALYFHLSPAFAANASPEQVCRVYGQLLRAFDRRPRIRATVGWTRVAIEKALSFDPGLVARYRSAVAQGQVETACVLCRPFSMLTLNEMVRVMVEGWQDAAERAGLRAVGLLPADGRLTPGWGDALRGYGYRYLAVPEGALGDGHSRFEGGEPVYVDGWTTVVFQREPGRVFCLDLETETLGAYLRYAAAGKSRTWVVSIDAEHLIRNGLIEPFLERLEECDPQFVSLSDVAATPSAGSLSVSAVRRVDDLWCGDEKARRRNALLDRVWGCRQGVEALRAGCTYANARGSDEPPPPLCPTTSGEAERALQECRVQRLEWLARLRPLPDLPANALGVLRVFEQHDRAHRGNLLQVVIPLPSCTQPDRVIFVDRDVVVPSQYLGRSGEKARYLLAVDIAAGALRDLIVLPEGRAVTVEGLDVTPRRLLNPWLALLLDERGQVTSLRYQGRECLCCPGNLVRGYLLDVGTWMYPERTRAEVVVSERGPLRVSVAARQSLAEGVTLTRHIFLSLFNPLLECVTELEFAMQRTLGGRLVIGEFGLRGEQVRWSLPLRAGYLAHDVSSSGGFPVRRGTLSSGGQGPRPSVDGLSGVVFAAEDAVDVLSERGGVRYLVNRGRTRTFYYDVRPTMAGMRVGLIASMPVHRLNWQRLESCPGLGFPGHTYEGRYVYHYALLPLSPDVDVRTLAYNYPLLWTFYEV